MPTRFYIPVILGSSRRGRQSPRAARFIETHLRRLAQVDTEIIDLAEYNLPMLEERIRVRDDAPPRALEFAARLANADALVVVSPEYNGGCPAVLKNAIDYVLPELKRKPIAIVTVSGGAFGGIEALQQLRLVLLKMGALPLPASFPVTRVQDSFDEEGRPADPSWDQRAAAFLGELLWLTEAVAAQRERTGIQAATLR
jgi:NAD(P)H-dependent FMN reductase